MATHTDEEFINELADVVDLVKKLDRAMYLLWRWSTPDQVAQLDALAAFDHHDPMPFAKSGEELLSTICGNLSRNAA